MFKVFDVYVESKAFSFNTNFLSFYKITILDLVET